MIYHLVYLSMGVFFVDDHVQTMYLGVGWWQCTQKSGQRSNIELAPKNILINHTEMRKFVLNFKNKFDS